MRFRTHLLTSALLGLAVYPRAPQRAAAVLLAGTLIDIDHLVVYGLQTGDWSVAGALAYNRYRHRPGSPGDTRPRYGPLRSRLHNPLLLLPAAWALAADRPALRPVALGLSLHLLLDYLLWPRYTLAFLRAGRRCGRCGRADRRLTVYKRRGRGGPRLHTLCQPCFERRGPAQGQVVAPPVVH